MTWANHPVLYQMTHWWHWLAYGQNSAAVQSLAVVVIALAAIAVALFSARTYHKTLTQLEIARAEITIVQAQFDMERARLKEQRELVAVRLREDLVPASNDAARALRQ